MWILYLKIETAKQKLLYCYLLIPVQKSLPPVSRHFCVSLFRGLIQYKWKWNLVMRSWFAFIFCDGTIYTIYYLFLFNLRHSQPCYSWSNLVQLLTQKLVFMGSIVHADKHASSECRRLRREQPKAHIFSEKSFFQAQSYQSNHYQSVDVSSKPASRA